MQQEKRTWILADDGVWLFDKICLEADKVSNLIGVVPGNGNHGQEILKAMTTFSIIDNDCLRFFPLFDSFLDE
jgi:hypothetical protein